MRQLYLIGGSAGAGKTTAARAVAKQLGADWLQVDHVWMAIRAALPMEHPDRAILEFDVPDRAAERTPGEDVEQHIAGAAIVCRALTTVLEFAIHAAPIVVADGAWITPGFMTELVLPETVVRSAVIYEDDAADVKRAMRSRSSAPATTPWQARGAAMAWQYGNWLAGEANRTGVAVVAARPRETLLRRLAEALQA